jgi:hypothetical protein
MKKRSSSALSQKTLTVLGSALLLWAAVSIGIDVVRYGVGWGRYWWFCNLALLGIGVGIVTKDRGLLTGFVAIAIYTQVFWIFDNISYIFTGSAHFGLVEYLYQPSFPYDEFLITHYHYFTLPIAIVAILLLQGAKDGAVKRALVFNPIIFGVSYFVFSPDQNVNCIHQTCMPGYEGLQGPLYSIGFWLFIYSLHLVFAHLLEKRVFPLVRSHKLLRQGTVSLMALFCLLGVGLTVMDVRIRESIPVAKCDEQPTASVGVMCDYLRSNDKESVMMAYRAINESESRVLCRVEMSGHGTRQVLHEQLPIDPHSKMDLQALIDMPKSDVAIRVDYWCVDALDIKTASVE